MIILELNHNSEVYEGYCHYDSAVVHEKREKNDKSISGNISLLTSNSVLKS